MRIGVGESKEVGGLFQASERSNARLKLLPYWTRSSERGRTIIVVRATRHSKLCEDLLPVDGGAAFEFTGELLGSTFARRLVDISVLSRVSVPTSKRGPLNVLFKRKLMCDTLITLRTSHTARRRRPTHV